MRQFNVSRLGYVYLLGLLLGCGSEPLAEPELTSGSLRAAIELGVSTHDVASVRFDVVLPEDDCSATALATRTVQVEAELAPASVSGASEERHHFASGLLTLAPGFYRVCATPLQGDGIASSACAKASATTTVAEEQTTQLALVSQCSGTAAGGLDVGVSLNDPPQIAQVDVASSPYITVCESAELTVAATDPNADELSYAWEIISGDGGSLRATGAAATFSGSPGEYAVRVTVTDIHGASASLPINLRVSDAICEVPPPVFDIINAQCSPCHTTGASGGLKLAPADVAYSSLVSHAVGAAACAAQTRVVPGDAAASYLVAKLRGEPNICGVRMPRNRPALPEADIQTIEAWIDSLPH